MGRIYTTLTRECPRCGGRVVYSWRDEQRERSRRPEEGSLVEWNEGPCGCGATRRTFSSSTDVPEGTLWTWDETRGPRRPEECPRCGEAGDTFVFHEDDNAAECLECRLVWKNTAGGGWMRVFDQDPDSLELMTDWRLVVWDDREEP